jgi:hypothetical protein
MFDVSQQPGGLAPASPMMSAAGGISSALNSAMPWGAAIGAIGQAVSAPPAGPSNADSAGSIGTNFDSSGWNVTFGANSSIDSMRSQTTPTVSTTGGTTAGGGLAGGLGLGGIDQQTMLLIAAVLVVVVMKKKKRAA